MEMLTLARFVRSLNCVRPLKILTPSSCLVWVEEAFSRPHRESWNIPDSIPSNLDAHYTGSL